MKTTHPWFSAIFIAASVCANSANGVVVIHEIYSAGGSSNPSVLYKKDYIEVFNTAWTTVDISGWALDYASASGSFSEGNRFVFPLGTRIAAEDYFLIAVGTPGSAGEELEADLTTNSLSLSLQAGKLRIVDTTIAADAQTVMGPGVNDFVGYGASASLFEGSGPAPFASGVDAYWLSANRDDHFDSNDNAADFYVSLPTLNRARVPLPPVGDYNGDGIVNLGDYTVWRDTLGATLAPGSGADGDYSGAIDSGDYDLWRANFGSSGPGAVVAANIVPEPATVAGVLAVIGWGITLRRRESSSHCADE